VLSYVTEQQMDMATALAKRHRQVVDDVKLSHKRVNLYEEMSPRRRRMPSRALGVSVVRALAFGL